MNSNNSFCYQNKAVILGMDGGVLLGIVMGVLSEDSGLGMAFGLAAGEGYRYTLK